MQWILGLVLAGLVFFALRYWASLAPEAKKRASWTLVLGVAGAVLLVLVLTGRIHLITAAVAAVIPLLRKVPALLRHLPILTRLVSGVKRDRNGPDERLRRAADGMSEREACEVLGVAPGCSREEVIAAHRRLMQKLHPDRGGNDYLAAQVNEAKRVLLARRPV
ncbi:molecular chaperone DnaJ [Marinobacter lutaoensis]|uniref:Molecular chaperone DnaJ n=1 Tax=Marinobacter lutaoensis TaxID=135739 RepID=A0A1V2DSJ4_9GAMM|nr:DnaJ domain-containing protein [Marinobacter lutaoensis]ONF43440.1 molecular chaperone DnaJ [Marinobacter lutaoensis]